jgi:hypothetical protein
MSDNADADDASQVPPPLPDDPDVPPLVANDIVLMEIADSVKSIADTLSYFQHAWPEFQRRWYSYPLTSAGPYEDAKRRRTQAASGAGAPSGGDGIEYLGTRGRNNRGDDNDDDDDHPPLPALERSSAASSSAASSPSVGGSPAKHRRTRNMWTVAESHALMRAVRSESAGDWLGVLASDASEEDLLRNRSAGDCKDRYRVIKDLPEYNQE